MDYDSCRSLPAMFFEQAARLGDKPFLWAKRDGRYRSLSWAAAARDVRRLARGLDDARHRPRRPGRARRREPAGMGHRRSRDHERRGRHGAGLCDQYGRGPSPRLRQQRRRRGHRVEAAAVGARVGGGQPSREPCIASSRSSRPPGRPAPSTCCHGAMCWLAAPAPPMTLPSASPDLLPTTSPA